jgi:DNA-directed RNA polymerase specialized sigma24 family protein
MAAGDEYLSRQEVQRALARLGPADMVRLVALARTWSRKVGRDVHEDLLNEAIARALGGSRKWPATLPLGVFMDQTIRSIADQWAKQASRVASQPVDDPTEDPAPAAVPTQERDVALNVIMNLIQRELANDTIALGIFRLSLTDASPNEIQAELGINATEHDTGRRRLRRRLFQLFPDGLPL